MSDSMLETIKAKQRQAGAGIANLFNQAASTYGPFYGVYRGKVINNIDPMELNRLLVDVPTLPCSISSFAAPASPYGGTQVGLVLTPPVGADVWVKFENGDPSYPVWVGCFWTEGMKPVLAELPTQQVFSTISFNAMINDLPSEAEHLLEFGPPGFGVPVTVSLNSEAVTFTVGEVIMTVTVEEVSAVMASTDLLFTNENILMTAVGEVAVTAPEVSTTGNESIQGELMITGTVNQVGATEITGNVELMGALEVLGAMEIEGNVEIAGAIELEGNLGILGATEMAGDIGVLGAIEVAGDIALAGAIEVGGAMVSVAYTPGGLNTI
jgi:hypothetical protein